VPVTPAETRASRDEHRTYRDHAAIYGSESTAKTGATSVLRSPVRAQMEHDRRFDSGDRDHSDAMEARHGPVAMYEVSPVSTAARNAWPRTTTGARWASAPRSGIDKPTRSANQSPEISRFPRDRRWMMPMPLNTETCQCLVLAKDIVAFDPTRRCGIVVGQWRCLEPAFACGRWYSILKTNEGTRFGSIHRHGKTRATRVPRCRRRLRTCR